MVDMASCMFYRIIFLTPKVALALRFDYSVIRSIERDSLHVTEDACEEMFERWLNGEACEPVTWERLVQALDEAEHATLARKVWSHFSFQ